MIRLRDSEHSEYTLVLEHILGLSIDINSKSSVTVHSLGGGRVILKYHSWDAANAARDTLEAALESIGRKLWQPI